MAEPHPRRQVLLRGEDLQLAISEPKFGNASHGLLRFGTYQPLERSDERLVLAADVVPQTGTRSTCGRG